VTVVAVSDAGPLIHLAEVDSLDLLHTVDTLLIPEKVYEEIERGGVPDGLNAPSCDRIEADESIVEAGGLDPGERAAIAVAKERDAVLLTDDLAARDAASNSGIEVHGSIGIIALAYGRNRLDRDEAAALMRALQRETSLFVTDAIVERGIQMLDEQE